MNNITERKLAKYRLTETMKEMEQNKQIAAHMWGTGDSGTDNQADFEDSNYDSEIYLDNNDFDKNEYLSGIADEIAISDKSATTAGNNKAVTKTKTKITVKGKRDNGVINKAMKEVKQQIADEISL